MTAISFYQLLTTPLERALPKLLEKVYGAGSRCLLLADEARIAPLNDLLWTYDPGSFLPHGSLQDGQTEHQPILISASPEPANHASILVVTNGQKLPENATFERVLDLFDGNDPEALTAARSRYKAYKDAGHSLSYLKQTASGGWENKGAA